MDWRDAAQEAQRHVQVTARRGRHAGNDRRWLVIDVRQHPHPIALVELARDLGNVRRRIPVSEKSLEIRLSRFRKDLPVSLLVEAVDHHPVVSGQTAKNLRRLVAQRLKARRRHERGNKPFEIDRQAQRFAIAFELDDQVAARASMDESRARHFPRPDRACDGDRNVSGANGRAVEKPGGERAPERARRQSAQFAPEAEKARGVLALLDDYVVLLANDDQRAMGLDGTSQMDLLALAVGEVRGSKSRRRVLLDSQNPSLRGAIRRLVSIQPVFLKLGVQALSTDAEALGRDCPVSRELGQRVDQTLPLDGLDR